MQVKRFVSTSLVMAALAVALVGCGGGSSTKSVGSKGSTADVVAVDSPSYRFEPDTLKAAPNSEVSFTFKNEGKVVHNFTLSFLGVDQDVQPGETKQITFKVSQPPKGLDYYTFYDKNHQGDGMQGRLNIG
ncbi:MAG: cupredoxin domain-containing protein [Acidimicrobiales bacterium]